MMKAKEHIATGSIIGIQHSNAPGVEVDVEVEVEPRRAEVNNPSIDSQKSAISGSSVGAKKLHAIFFGKNRSMEGGRRCVW